MRGISVISSLAALVLLSPCAYSQSADVVYKNGKIYTVNDSLNWAQAMAIRDGKFIHVGSMEEMETFITPATEVIDLKGRMVMPGINDLHAHPLVAGQQELLECGFPITQPIEEIVKTLQNCANRTPSGDWIRGSRWPVEFLQTDTVPEKSILDEVTTDHPLYVQTALGALFNSRALEALGITRASSAVGNGLVHKDDNSEPTGLLHGAAARDALARVPPYSDSQNTDALRWAILELNKVGVTSAKDALVHEYGLRAYKTLDESGQLTVKIASSLAWKHYRLDATDEEKESIEHRSVYRTDRHDPDFIKIILDGVPPVRTAAMLDPYVPDEKHGEDFTGKLMHSPEQLRQDVTQLDAQGLAVKIHSTGDRSVRVSLDAFEAARRTNDNNRQIHEVAHAEFIHPDDIPRFKELNVAAEMSPVIWYPSSLSIAAGRAGGGERGKHIFPVKSLLQAGALVIYGSDWPSVSHEPSPWPGMEAMVTRRNPYTNTGEQFWPEQAIALWQAIQIFTRNGAIAMKKGDVSGSIEVGKYADFIVLDRNIFDIPITELSEIKVLWTVFEGQVTASPEQ